MSSDDLDDFWVHTVSVETYTGRTGKGVDGYDDPVTVPCLLSRKLRFVRNADGETVASEASLSAATSFADVLTPKSRVTVDGKPTTIITAAVSTSGGLDLPDRVKVYLQ